MHQCHYRAEPSGQHTVDSSVQCWTHPQNPATACVKCCAFICQAGSRWRYEKWQHQCHTQNNELISLQIICKVLMSCTSDVSGNLLRSSWSSHGPAPEWQPHTAQPPLQGSRDLQAKLAWATMKPVAAQNAALGPCHRKAQGNDKHAQPTGPSSNKIMQKTSLR